MPLFQLQLQSVFDGHTSKLVASKCMPRHVNTSFYFMFNVKIRIKLVFMIPVELIRDKSAATECHTECTACLTTVLT